MPSSRRGEALELSDQLLADIEYSRLPPTEIAKKASRLARLLDDHDATEWLRLEIAGYTPSSRGKMTDAEVTAAVRSRRRADDLDGEARFDVASLAWLQAQIETSNQALASAVGGGSSGGDWALAVENKRDQRAMELRATITERRALVDGIVGAIYDYVCDRYEELRFGALVETAFDRLRHEVDRDIAAVAPDALARLSAAFENATSDSPEHWANAASTCRRLIKEVADTLRPPGPDVNGRKMGEENYINRLVDWITARPVGETLRTVIASDLEFLGHRLDAVVDAGNKGAHAEVSRHDASRYLVGTYLTLGDVLRLRPPESLPEAEAVPTEPAPPNDEQIGLAAKPDEI